MIFGASVKWPSGMYSQPARGYVIGQELTEQGKRDELLQEIENRAMYVIEGTASESDLFEEKKEIIAEARRKLAEDGAMPVVTDAMEGRNYSGEIITMGSAYAVQKIDEGRGIVHSLQYLKDSMQLLNESNPEITITYDSEMNGSVGVNETTEYRRSASMAV